MILGRSHIHRQTIDFDLLDAGNVVYHPNYLIICERARNAALEAAGYSFPELWSDGYALALVSSSSKYLKPATVGLQVVVLTTATRETRLTLAVRQELVPLAAFDAPLESGFVNVLPSFAEKELIYAADISLTCVKMNPLRATRFPARLVEALAIPSGAVAVGERPPRNV